MLRTDKDYQEAVARLAAEKQRLHQYEQELQAMELTDEQVHSTRGHGTRAASFSHRFHETFF